MEESFTGLRIRDHLQTNRSTTEKGQTFGFFAGPVFWELQLQIGYSLATLAGLTGNRLWYYLLCIIAVAVTLGVAGVIDACAPQPEEGIPVTGANVPIAPSSTSEYNDVPFPSMMPPSDTLAFFTQDEAAAVDAIIARLIPETPQDPGAVGPTL